MCATINVPSHRIKGMPAPGEAPSKGGCQAPMSSRICRKALPGLERFHLAGQWVEPGADVPAATMSGRHVVEIMCAAQSRQFRGSLVEQRASRSDLAARMDYDPRVA